MSDDVVKRLRAENEKLRSALVGARDLIEFWGAYANEYFKEKHGFHKDLASIDAILKETDK